MKTTFSTALMAALAIAWMALPSGASTQPDLEEEGEQLETAPAATLASAELQPGPAQVAGENVNVRAQATINSEVITQMQDGEEVFVEEVILRPDAKDKDPARWAKIAYPTKASAWVHSLYIDSDSSTVKPRKLNVRSGPGENYTVVGTLRSGDTVAQLGVKNEWLLIQPPEGSTAYIAAKLLRQELPAEEVAAEEVAVDEVAVAEPETIETETVEMQPEETEGGDVPEGEGAASVQGGEEGSSELAQLPELEPDATLEVAPELEAIPADPLPPRIVNREGVVRTYTQPHAPSHYRLVSADNGRMINYLHTTSTNLDLSRYVGLRIVATGEESLDERWTTPVLTLKKIVVVDLEE